MSERILYTNRRTPFPVHASAGKSHRAKAGRSFGGQQVSRIVYRARLWLSLDWTQVTVEPVESFLDHFVAGDIVTSVIQDAALVLFGRAE